MKKSFFRTLAKLNKKILPVYSKDREFDLAKASKFQMVLIGYKTWVTKNALD